MENTDILLIFPRPTDVSPQKNQALSIFFPGEAAAKAGFNVNYWDERYDSWKILEEKAKQAKIFGVSSLSGYMLGRAILILKWLKKHYPDKPTILGGVHATFLPENSLQEPMVDYVVLGEGEERLPALLNAIFSKNGLGTIDGIGYKLDAKIIVQPRIKILDLATQYVSPLSERTAFYFKAAAERNEVILPTSRGCPWASGKRACTFCAVRGQYLGAYRGIPFNLWSKDINAIYALHPFSLIEFQDENSAYFIKHPEYATYLQKKRIKYHLHIRADQLQKEEIVKKLATTGCYRIHIGVEAGTDRVRNEIYNKGEKKEHFYKAAALLAKYGIEGVYTYMVGAPGETMQEIIETLKFSDEIKAIHPKGKSRATIYVLMALPGTDIMNVAQKSKWMIPQTMEEWSKTSAAYNPALPEKINNIHLIAMLHHNWYHKTRQNFPGLWKLLIMPFQALIEIRWKFRFFSYFGEKYFIQKLMEWRSQYSEGRIVAK